MTVCQTKEKRWGESRIIEKIKEKGKVGGGI